MLKVSIIVPVYGVEKFIERCARSIFEQTYSNLEILFVDDCSPDESITILKRTLVEYPERKEQVRLLSQSKNKGVAAARKLGMESATGDYTIQIDSDDYVDSHMIQCLVSEAERSHADVVFSDYNLVNNSGSMYIKVNPSLEPLECLKQVLRGDVHASLWNKLIRRNIYIEHDIWPAEGLNMREDFSVVYRVLYFSKKLAYVPMPFYYYVLRKGSVSDGRMNERQQSNTQDLIMQMNEFYFKQSIREQSLIDSFCYFKVQVITGILLFGSIKDLKKNLFNDVTVRHIITHPLLPYAHKIMGILFHLGIKPLVWLYRKVVDLYLRVRY